MPVTGGGAGPRPGNTSSSMDILTKTSIDLELDLAAQQSKLVVLSEEIERLRQIKKQMEEAKDKGEKELPKWLQEDDKFQYLLASVCREHLTGYKCFFLYRYLIFIVCSWRKNLPKKHQRRDAWKNF